MKTEYFVCLHSSQDMGKSLHSDRMYPPPEILRSKQALMSKNHNDIYSN